MSLLAFLYLLAFLFYLWLIVFVLCKNPKSGLNRTCALLILCFAIWDFFDLLVHIHPEFITLTYSAIGWCSFPSFAFWFLLIFTQKKRVLKNWIIYPLFLIIPSLLIYKQWKGFMIIDFAATPYGLTIIWSKSIWKYLYFTYYNLFILTGFYLCFDFMRKTEKLSEKKQARIILTTGIITLIVGSLTNVILPELKIYILPNIASILILIWATGLVYAITKYGLMTITPAAAAENILATMADSLILISPERYIIRVNKATLDLLGFKEEELIDKPIDTLLNGNSLFRGEQFERLIQEGQIRDYNMEYKTKSGETIPVSFSASVMYNQEKAMVGIVGVAKDLRQMQQLIRALQEERAHLDIKVRQRTLELEKANIELKAKTEELIATQVQLIQSAKMTAVGQLGAGVAHELNNPLGGILGYAQFILEKIKRPEFGPEDFKSCTKYMESIERESTRCKGIVESLLKFSRRPVLVNPEPLDIAEALKETLFIIGYQLKLKNILLATDIQENLAKVTGITNQLQQVFTNLILNAQQAMPEGGELKITAQNILDEKTKTPTHLRIEFTDSGCGISEENLKHIFEPFFTTKLKEKGTGLGLAVSYQIIQDHKGSVEIKSQVGKGTAISISLPAAV
jgi:PAS domain S-box-containing protein